jgi:hypothetical protein
MQKIIFIVLILLLLIYFSTKLLINKTSPVRIINQNIKDQIFTLEIADNNYLLAKGLSKRQSLCPNCGMLFIFKTEMIQTFWMKDTLLPLDIIFINSQGIVTDIYTAQPEIGKSDFQLTLYQSTSPTKYVIELNAGTSKTINLKIGDRLDLNL